MTNQEQTFDTVIVGMGLTGYSCACYLASQGVDFAVVDSRNNPPMLDQMFHEFPEVPLYTSGLEEHVLCNASRILLSPGVSLREPALQAAREAGVEILGDIELFCQQATAPIIAVTGSNGKSTVASLVAEMARAAGMRTGLGGNIGLPALDLLDKQQDVYVLELSSFQLELVRSLNARAAAVLNVTADHMDRYDSLDDYAAAKARIFSGTGSMVINRDDAIVNRMVLPERNTVGFTLNIPPHTDFGVRENNGQRWLAHGENSLLPLNELKIAGDHNVMNCLAALALATELGIEQDAMYSVLRQFTGLPHRCQFVAEINGVRWFNDSKGTNPGATCAAVAGLADNKNIILIAGGDGKGADFESLADIARDYLHSVIVIGRDGSRIKEAVQAHVPVYEAGSLKEAVTIGADNAAGNDVVLLSPACASFDMFDNYMARGDAFTTAVRNLEAAT